MGCTLVEEGVKMAFRAACNYYYNAMSCPMQFFCPRLWHAWLLHNSTLLPSFHASQQSAIPTLGTLLSLNTFQASCHAKQAVEISIQIWVL